jgi:prepilin-type N-terminal cleavage/methylation domain-containing protein
MKYRSIKNRTGETGFTLLEVLISLAILSIMGAGVISIVSQTFNQSTRNAEAMKAIEQVENAAYWINQDALMTQTISFTEGPGFPLILGWQDEAGDLNRVTYSISGSKLLRTLSINDVAVRQSVAAANINSGLSQTNCVYGAGVLNFQATSTIGASTQTRNYQIKIRIDQPSSYLTITTNDLPSAKSGTYYTQTLTGTGGTGTLTWAIIAGNLPSGMTCSSTGIISGTPNVPQYFNAYDVTVQVTDSLNISAAKSLTLMVNPLAITSTTLPDGKKDKNYGTSGGTPSTAVYVSASGGTTIYTWSKTAGNLPPGIILNSSTGRISGMPDATTGGNTYSFTITVTDSSGQTTSKNMAIYVHP